jgi:hypothetical protein
MSFEPREFLRHMLAETEYLAVALRGVVREACEQDQTLP